MLTWQMKKPVAFFVFNRPDTTQRVFNSIREARPQILLLIADGPRDSHPADAGRCAAVRAVVDRVDWPCQVVKNYSDTNLGCRRRLSSGLDWVFTTVEEAIILEDDCLPHPTFFRFCEELLDRYRGDERVMMISGDNFQFGRNHTGHSYYFSRYTHIWGWATWRRAWRCYDVDMKQWLAIRTSTWLRDLLGDPSAIRSWNKIFDEVTAGKIDTWDYQWTFACWLHNGLAALPNVNLVSNIGFHEGATHTAKNGLYGAMKVEPMLFPLVHPHTVVRHHDADTYTQTTHVSPGFVRRIMRKLKAFYLRTRP